MTDADRSILAQRRRDRAALALIWLLPFAWLLPNHHFPWATAWQDGLSLLALAAVALVLRSPLRPPPIWLAFGALVLVTVGLQWALGVLSYAGDAWMVLLYVAAFVLATGLGRAGASGRLAASPDAGGGPALVVSFCVALAVAAGVSGFIGLLQWIQQPLLGVWMIALPPGGRPFGNFGQPNHLSSAAVLGFGALLWLHQARRLPTAGLWVGGVVLLAVVVMTGSRTGLLQVALMLLGAVAFRARWHLRLRRREALGFVLAAAILTLSWPALNAALTLDNARPVAQLASESVRWPAWLLLLHAVGEAPWLGHGWLQVASAQWSVALEAPPIHRLFEHSHNLAVDFLVWAGVPAGGLLLLLVLLGLCGPDPRRIRANSFWLRAMAVALLVHGLLEYPLEHAYFLLPVGLLLGFAHGIETPESVAIDGALRAPRLQGMAISGLLLAAATGVTAADYIRAEVDHRAFRMESARIGGAAAAARTVPLDLRVLDQLEAFLAFARTEARAGMTVGELEAFERIVRRYPIPPAMLRLALAQGINGRPEAAAATLARLCRMHDPLRCDEGRQSWAVVRPLHPALSAVPFPDSPASPLPPAAGSAAP